ncbi:hypothetical protein ZIOFF_035054 [Zingiber officinale]|uniref:Clathrin heavy chain n=1 Tax=Zingiber officinale TaxID=94328 RepID=A0A8J5L6X6_ZINOF|nr:hypothetical protein ZIOFF_035054 [Zingiber officinale]
MLLTFKLFDDAFYEAAKIIFAFISNWVKLACTLEKLKQLEGAVDGLMLLTKRIVQSHGGKFVLLVLMLRSSTWCKYAVDDLEEISEDYQNRGCFNELISLMESGLGMEHAHVGIFTELGALHARYRPEKLMEHIQFFSTRLNIPKLIRACDEQQHWKELTYLYIQYDEFDNAATTIMNHSLDAWDHMRFKDVIVKVANVELYYKAVHFYLQEHPDLINDVWHVLALRVDHSRVVDIMRKAGHLHLVKPYMIAVQSNNVSVIGLAQRIEKFELLEMQRIAAYIYKKAARWKQSIALPKKDKLYKDATETCSQSGDHEVLEELLVYFIVQVKQFVSIKKALKESPKNGMSYNAGCMHVLASWNHSDIYFSRTISLSIANFSATVRLEPSQDLVIHPHPFHDLVSFSSIQHLVPSFLPPFFPNQFHGLRKTAD